MNFIEREIDGLRPDVVLMGAMPERREIHDYAARMLRALGYPKLILPTHWDRFNVPFDVSQSAALARLQPFVDEIRALSAGSQVVVPRYFSPVVIP